MHECITEGTCQTYCEREGLDVAKLKGADNLFRVRKGDFRIVYYLKGRSEPVISSIERRSEKTYRKF